MWFQMLTYLIHGEPSEWSLAPNEHFSPPKSPGNSPFLQNTNLQGSSLKSTTEGIGTQSGKQRGETTTLL